MNNEQHDYVVHTSRQTPYYITHAHIYAHTHTHETI